MSAQKLGSRYATALMEIAQEQNKVDIILNDIIFFQKLLDQSRDFLLLMRSPVVKGSKKANILKEVIKDKVDPLFLSFMELLIMKGRDQYVESIDDAFINLYNEINGITEVTLTSAVELSDKETDKIVELLKQEDDLQTVKLTKVVDPELIGGFVLQYDDKLYDASIQRQINIIKKELNDSSYVKSI